MLVQTRCNRVRYILQKADEINFVCFLVDHQCTVHLTWEMVSFSYNNCYFDSMNFNMTHFLHLDTHFLAAMVKRIEIESENQERETDAVANKQLRLTYKQTENLNNREKIKCQTVERKSASRERGKNEKSKSHEMCAQNYSCTVVIVVIISRFRSYAITRSHKIYMLTVYAH